MQLDWSPQVALTVVMAAQGYPGSYAQGGAISGLDAIRSAKVGSTRCNLCWRRAVICLAATGGNCSKFTSAPLAMQVFHAGTATDGEGQLVSAGGRVLGITALGADIAEAQQKAYQVGNRQLVPAEQ